MGSLTKPLSPRISLRAIERIIAAPSRTNKGICVTENPAIARLHLLNQNVHTRRKILLIGLVAALVGDRQANIRSQTPGNEFEIAIDGFKTADKIHHYAARRIANKARLRRKVHVGPCISRGQPIADKILEVLIRNEIRFPPNSEILRLCGQIAAFTLQIKERRTQSVPRITNE